MSGLPRTQVHRRWAAFARAGGSPAERIGRAVAVLALTLPAVLLAHLLTTGVAAPAADTVLAAAAVAILAATLPATGRGGLALTVGLGQVVAQALLVWHGRSAGTGSGGCLAVVGRGAEVGLRLTVLRADASCPPGTLAAGTGATAGLAVLLSAAAILAGHALAAVLAAAALEAGRAVREVLVRLGRLVLRAGPAIRVAPTAAPRALRPAADSLRRLRQQWTPAPRARRGPPVVRPA